MATVEEIARGIARSRIARARAMPESEKLLAGPRLFDEVCERMKIGIRYDFPELNEAGVMDELRRRLAINRRIAENPL